MNSYLKKIIFEFIKSLDMKIYETVILNKQGKDIGLRENSKGAIYIKPKKYFKNQKVQDLIKELSKSNIVNKKLA